jgi:thiol-disulfide isomerase/thioredoxin
MLLGPLALSWPNLALLLGVLAFVGLAARRGQESAGWWALLAALLAGRVGYAIEHLSVWPSFGAAVVGVVDIRSGGWSWFWGVGGGVVAAGALLRRQARVLLVPALGAAAAMLLPLGVQQTLSGPVHADASRVLNQAVLLYLEPGDPQPRGVRWNDLPKPMLVSIWATWCPSCRAHMPLLAEYQAKGYPIVMLNTGEDVRTVRAFLQQAGLPARTLLDSAGLQQALWVVALPTTLLIGSDGQIMGRHMGTLNRAQLEEFLSRLR